MIRSITPGDIEATISDVISESDWDLRGALILRSLWPQEDSGERVSLVKWAEEIGITRYALSLFLAGSSGKLAHQGHVMLSWIVNNHGKEIACQWLTGGKTVGSADSPSGWPPPVTLPFEVPQLPLELKRKYDFLAWRYARAMKKRAVDETLAVTLLRAWISDFTILVNGVSVAARSVADSTSQDPSPGSWDVSTSTAWLNSMVSNLPQMIGYLRDIVRISEKAMPHDPAVHSCAEKPTDFQEHTVH